MLRGHRRQCRHPLLPLLGRQRGPARQFGRKTVPVFHQNILAAGDGVCPLPDQPVGAHAHFRKNAPRHGEYIPVLLLGVVDGQHRPAGPLALHRQHTQGQPADNAVADPVVAPVRAGFGGILRNQHPGHRDILLKRPAGGRIKHIQAVGQHRDGPAAALQRPLEGHRVHTLGNAGHHQGSAPRQLQADPGRRAFPVSGTLPRAYDADGGFLVKIKAFSLHVQQHGFVVELVQTVWVVRVLAGHQTDA